MAHIGQPPSKGSATADGPDMNPPPYAEGEPKLMAGEKSKSIKRKPVKQTKAKNQKPLTLEGKLSDSSDRMSKIVEGNDPGYHLP